MDLTKILIIIGIVVISVMTLLVITSFIVFKYIYKRYPDHLIDAYDEKIRIKDPECIEVRDMLRKMPYEVYTITGYLNHQITGYFYKRQENNTKLVILSHGWQGQAMRDCVLYSKFYFERNDFDVLVLSHMGHYPSEGKYIGFGSCDGYNIKLWVDEVNRLWPDKYDIYLHGVSMGAHAVMMSTKYHLHPSVKAIVEDCGFISGFLEMSHVCKNKYHLPSFIIMSLVRLWVKIFLKYDCKKENTIDALKNTQLPILFIHGTADKFVPTEMTIKNYEEYQGIKDLMLIDNATHARSYRVEPVKYVDKVVDFLYKYESKNKRCE